MQLKTHYLGTSFRNKIKSDADKVLDTSYYDGKARNFTLEDYCGKLKKAFADLEDCGEATSEDRKVRVFLKGLRSPDLQAARNQIIATNTLYSSVDAAMNYTKTIENANDSTKGTANRNISSLRREGGGDSKKGGGKFKGSKGKEGGKFKGKGKGKGNPKTAFLSKEKWLKLTPEEQQAMREAREKVGITGKRKLGALETEEPPGKKTVRILEDKDKKEGVGDKMSRK
jgi:hypothetical protein